MSSRPRLAEIGLNTGKKARLHRILYKHGLSNGTALFLPYDQGLEHGPRDFFANPAASDPGYIVRLAVEGGFNGVAVQIGLAEKFYWDYAGEVPGDQVTLEKAREAMEAGATGLIFGRNVWQRDHDESLRFIAHLKEILAKYPSNG